MKKRIIVLLGLLLLLMSCAPEDIPDEIVQNSDEEMDEGDVSIVPSHQLAEENYRMILPARPSEARGVITRQVANRLDIDEMEEGLRRHSTEEFDPEEYYFEEGQYLTEDMVIGWIDELNPTRPEPDSDQEEFENNPRVFSHVLEQNFLERIDEDHSELSGVSLGIALKSVYQFETDEGGPYFKPISEEEMLEAGKDIAQTILERVRQIDDLHDVPIMIALYREEAQSSPVPGNFVAKTVVPASDMLIGDWEETNEEYVLFPSDEAKEEYPSTHETMQTFGEKIAEYFPNYVGYIGEGFYVNDDLKKLTIEVPIEFHGSSEVIGFTQYVYGVINGLFSDSYDLEIKIMSSHKMESVIYQDAGDEEPTVHIFH